MEKFGDCVKRLRKVKGLKIYQLAEKIGTSPEFITQTEKGRKYPSIITLDKLARILGDDLKTIYFKEHRPDILALIGKDLKLPGSKANKRTRKTK